MCYFRIYLCLLLCFSFSWYIFIAFKLVLLLEFSFEIEMMLKRFLRSWVNNLMVFKNSGLGLGLDKVVLILT